MRTPPYESDLPQAPTCSKGLVEGRRVFVIVAPSTVFITRGVELIITRLDGSSDVLSELANGHVRTEPGSVTCDRVGKALVWHSAAP